MWESALLGHSQPLGLEVFGEELTSPLCLSLSSHGILGVPRTLLNLCRVAVRRALGKYRLHVIPSLPLPDPIKKFLLYE